MDIAHTDVLIVGAGPAGLQLAHELDTHGTDYLVLEAGESPGTFFRRFPRHRKLISINKPNVGTAPGDPLRYDWNSLLGDEDGLRFTTYTDSYFPQADRLVDYLADYAARHRVHAHFGVRVTLIERAPESKDFLVLAADGRRFAARRVVVATGLNEPYLPDIPGIEHTELYTEAPVDPNDFRNQRVLVIGKGNSAFETADNMIETAATIHLCSPSPIRLAWRSHYVGHVRAVNNNFLDTYLLKSQNAVLDAKIERIEKRDNGFRVAIAYTHAGGQRATYEYDRIVTCAGFVADLSIFSPELGVEPCVGGKYPAMASDYQAVQCPGLYFAGTLTHARDFRKTMSGFIHGFRYNVRALARFLAREDRALLPEAKLACDPAQLAQVALQRLNESDAIFLQPGYMCDVFVPGGDGVVRHYQGIPLDYVRDRRLGDRLWTLTLEYGPEPDDPFRTERDHSPAYAARTPFLHPVVRSFADGVEAARLDLLEDLENQFGEIYLPALREFFGDWAASSISQACR